MRITIPTFLTLARILMIPVLVVVFYLHWRWASVAAMLVFAFASITDWLDGWIARRYHQYSAFGAFLDPVADKLMVSTALFLIVQGHPTAWMAFWASVIVGREIAVSALREWMAGLGQRAAVKVAAIGKIKTTVQMLAIGFLLYSIHQPYAPNPTLWIDSLAFRIGDWGLAAAALLTLWSGVEYLIAACPAVRAGEGRPVDTSPETSKMAGSTRE